MMAILTTDLRRARAQVLSKQESLRHAHQEATNIEAERIYEDVKEELDNKIDLLIKNFRVSYPSGCDASVDLHGKPPALRYGSEAVAASSRRVLRLVLQKLRERSDVGERFYVRIKWGGAWELYAVTLSSRRLHDIVNVSMGIKSIGAWTR
ncbi:MAG: hypothetical protein ABIP74_01490 [Candidatus Saccharimonas sp.]